MRKGRAHAFAGLALVVALLAFAGWWRDHTTSAPLSGTGRGSGTSVPMPSASEATPEALRAAALAIEKTSDDPKLHLWYGFLLYRVRRFPEAIAAFDRVLALDPISADAYHGIGLAHGKADEHAAAEVAFRHALALAPEMAAAHNGLGVVLLRQDRRGEAETAFVRALELDPGLEVARANLETVRAPAASPAPEPEPEQLSPAGGGG